MAKSITQFEIISRGGPNEPTQMFVQYVVADGDLKKQVSKEIDSPNFNKKVHTSGQIGEMWRDLVEVAKTDEGIS